MKKVTEFLKRIHVNIRKSLFITFKSNKYFLLIKNKAFEIFFVYTMKIKDEILSRLQQFWIWIEKQFNKKIMRIRADDKLNNKIFVNWFNIINIQWKSLILYIFEQNEVIKRDMYIIASFIQIIHKSCSFSLKLWNYIIEEIIHTWNKIITSFNQWNIILFKYVNDVQSDVFHLKTLNCKVYIYVLKIIIKHKLNDRSWKEILMSYESLN